MSSELYTLYTAHKAVFAERLAAFRAVWETGDDLAVFAELCYCVCTSREKAGNAQKAVDALCVPGPAGPALACGDFGEVDAVLRENGIALHPQKAARILANRAAFYPGTKKRLSELALDNKTAFESRETLVRLVAGFGFKESSHFLRNIGRTGLCILDRHILRQLARHRVIADSAFTLTPRKYLEIEQAMASFAETEGIPLDALDMVLMYQENPLVLK